MDTQTQIERLIELAIVQRTELKQLVEQLPQLREHLNAEIERTFEEAEPQIRTELEEFVTRQAADKTATLGTALEAKIGELAKSLEESAQAKYSALIATRDQNADLLAQAEERIATAAGELPAKVKDIVAAELARFPRAGEIDQLRKEFAEPKSLNPRGKWQAGESYNKLDLVTINGDSYTSNIDGNRTRPSRSSADWTLVAARGTGGGGGPTSLSELTTVPSNGDILIGSGTSWVTSNLTAGAGISITVGAGEITISATDGDITLDDGTAASPSLHFTNDADTGLYRPAANTLGISVSGTQVAYFDTDGLTIPSAGVVAGGSFHGANGNANNPTFSFESDQDTGMYRHGTNELGFTIGGTQKAVLTSTTFTVTPNLVGSGTLTVNSTTDSSSKDTGAIVTEGGVGIEKKLYVGTDANVGGNLTVSGTGTSSFAGFLTRTHAQGTDAYLAVTTTGKSNQVVGYNDSGGTLYGVATGKGYIGNLNAYDTVVTDGTYALATFSNTTGNFATKGNISASGSGTFSGFLSRTHAQGTDAYLAVTTTGKSNQIIGYNDSGSTLWGVGTGKGYIGNLNAYDTVVTDGTYALATFSNTTGNFATKGNLTVSGGTVTSGTGTLTLNSSANTVMLQSAGTTALTLDSSQNATFAGTVTVPNDKAIYLKDVSGTAQRFVLNSGDVIYIEPDQLHKISIGGSGVTNVGIGGIGVAGNSVFGGTIAIGNTVQTAAAVASTHKVTISIGGSTYYLLATNV